MILNWIESTLSHWGITQPKSHMAMERRLCQKTSMIYKE